MDKRCEVAFVSSHPRRKLLLIRYCLHFQRDLKAEQGKSKESVPESHVFRETKIAAAIRLLFFFSYLLATIFIIIIITFFLLLSRGNYFGGLNKCIKVYKNKSLRYNRSRGKRKLTDHFNFSKKEVNCVKELI